MGTWGRGIIRGVTRFSALGAVGFDVHPTCGLRLQRPRYGASRRAVAARRRRREEQEERRGEQVPAENAHDFMSEVVVAEPRRSTAAGPSAAKKERAKDAGEEEYGEYEETPRCLPFCRHP